MGLIKDGRVRALAFACRPEFCRQSAGPPCTAHPAANDLPDLVAAINGSIANLTAYASDFQFA
jgi:hypothetical protein